MIVHSLSFNILLKRNHNGDETEKDGLYDLIYDSCSNDNIEVTITKMVEEYRNMFSYDGIRFCFYSGDNLIDFTK